MKWLRPRGRIDIRKRDWLCGLGDCFFTWKKPSSWATPQNGILGYSVRTGLDLLLQEMQLPPGSEIIVSGINIPDIFKILEHHQFKVIPLPLDQHTLQIDLSQFTASISPQTRLVLFAHLFGAIIDLSEVARICAQSKIFLIEDCAQAWTGPNGYVGHPQCNVSLFSFGTIKTQTCLGGALWIIRDDSLRTRVQTRNEKFPYQSRKHYLKRLFNAMLIQIAVQPVICTWINRIYNLDSLQSRMVKGFPGDQLFAQIRKQPSIPLLHMMRRCIPQDIQHKIKLRTFSGKAIQQQHSIHLQIGDMSNPHSFWVNPILAENPQEFIQQQRAQGIDATQKASSLALHPSTSLAANHLKMESVVFLPHRL